jgi:Spy/CpxP family protein refolding chaperone
MKRILLIILIATAATAAPPHARGPRPGPDPAMVAKVLGLTAAQIEQAKALRETMRTTVEPLAETQKANHEQIEAAVEAGDATKAGTLMIANHQLAEQMKAAHDTFRTAFEALLTPEQKTKFEMMQELGEHRRPRRGPRD